VFCVNIQVKNILSSDIFFSLFSFICLRYVVLFIVDIISLSIYFPKIHNIVLCVCFGPQVAERKNENK